MRLLMLAMCVLLMAGCCCPSADVPKAECERRCASVLSTCEDVCGSGTSPMAKGCRDGCTQSTKDCRAKCK